jgi:hypothetical protein
MSNVGIPGSVVILICCNGLKIVFHEREVISHFSNETSTTKITKELEYNFLSSWGTMLFAYRSVLASEQ